MRKKKTIKKVRIQDKIQRRLRNLTVKTNENLFLAFWTAMKLKLPVRKRRSIEE